MVKIRAASDPLWKMIFHIPNEGVGGAQGFLHTRKLLAEGMSPGFPDIGILVPRGTWHGAFVEVKRLDGEVSDEQRDWIYRLRAQGYFATVIRLNTFEPLIQFTEQYLAGKI